VEYFEQALLDEGSGSSASSPLLDQPPAEYPNRPYPPTRRSKKAVGPQKLISEVVLVRRTMELHEAFRNREEAWEELEKAHIQLARNVADAVREHQQFRSSDSSIPPDPEKQAIDGMDVLTSAVAPFVDKAGPEGEDSIWVSLRNLSPKLLDAYQPLTKLNHLFKGQKVPAIDFYLQKYNLYSRLVEDLRATPDTTFSASPTAFVTFASAADARRALRTVPKHPSKNFACMLAPGPDVRDIVWDKLVMASFGGDLIRSIVVEGFCWLFIIFWLIPVASLLAFVSITNIAKVWPALSRYLENHTTTNALLTSFAPTLLLSILLFLVPTLLINFSNWGQHFWLLSRLHNAVLGRYWKVR
jgi:hypothetical protein